ncbi:PRC-barrel domain-containing protein [Clostridium cellulovorans]|uniref:PRC-barrel domain protein n=1 Tax=Clostridium cellulovorans (strain ATCC 35296 / DSM 3052 / OCM 3 / 743B) TaxID=573061 RepID=D9SL56_CLOC7|nr:PRC-barrel domain-containing protein [Clostridium cellulovorans]ADL51572.1 PRC-barrel domain protein [Clostridium cellulovorans 743B]
MYRLKSVLAKKVKDLDGKKLGDVADILVDFEKKIVVGFKLSRLSVSKKKKYILISDVIAFGQEIIARNSICGEYLSFSEIKYLDIIDVEGSILGVLEDLIIEEETMEIKGLIVSSGFINSLLYGKKILSPHKVIIGNEYILLTESMGSTKFISKAHLLKGENQNDKHKG